MRATIIHRPVNLNYNFPLSTNQQSLLQQTSNLNHIPGNEKDEDQADTVGCCSLRYEHVSLHEELNGKDSVVVFDFLGKDSIRYYNEVSVEKRVFKNLQLFKENKKEGDDLFDRLNTSMLNEHLKELMDGELDSIDTCPFT